MIQTTSQTIKMPKTLQPLPKKAKKVYNNYKQMYEIACSELTFESLLTMSLYDCIHEINKLCKMKTKHALIEKVIANAKERLIIDKMIHSSSRFAHYKNK